MLVDPVKHYFYIWLIHVRLSRNYSVHHRDPSLSKTGNNISMINVI